MESVIISITLPKDILAKIDQTKGDVNRSRYILRLVEKAYGVESHSK